MTALGVLLLETLCCLGLGAAALRVLRIDVELSLGEHWSLAFATGFGILGWLVFPLGIAGLLTPGALTVLLSVGAFAAVLLRRPGPLFQRPHLDGIGKGLMALLAVVFVFDLMEGIAPPADADTLAYQFTIAKRFFEAGRIEFIPRPLEGAIPLIVQMTYVPALGLGGEMALSLWTMATGWAAAALLFVLCRRHIGVNWSLAVTLIFLTTPAVIYGGGSGQVEPRMSLFVMVAAWAASRALETGRVNYAILAGIGGGFYMAAKYLGLLFAAAAGVVLLFQRRWLMHGALFSAAALTAGFQWYAWNILYTGDPVFPALFQWLGRGDLAFWDQAQNLVFKEVIESSEMRVPQTPLWLVLYPFSATLGFGNLLDAGRVGWGPYGLLVMPFTVFGLWQHRDRVRQSPLLVYAALMVLFYVEWFFLSGTQRIRHLVPVLPLFLISVTVAAERFAADGKYRGPLLAAVVVTLVLQAGIHGLFARNYAKYLYQGADREAFLAGNVFGYPAVSWINANLTKADRVYINLRQIRYYLEVPEFFGPLYMQSVIELRADKTNARTLHRQLRAEGVTHMLLTAGSGGRAGYQAPYDLLVLSGCLTSLKRFRVQKIRSRTLPTLDSETVFLDVLRLGNESCLK